MFEHKGTIQSNLWNKGHEKGKGTKWLLIEICIFNTPFNYCTIKQPWNDPIKTVPIKLMAIMYCQIHDMPNNTDHFI